MGLFSRKKKNEEVKTKLQPKYEEKHDIKKLSLYITIVDRGFSQPVIRLFEKMGSSAQFVQMGEGTAVKEIREILGIEDNEKEVILSIIRKEVVNEVTKELDNFFSLNKSIRGIGFSIPLTSLIGVRLYEFLSNSQE